MKTFSVLALGVIVCLGAVTPVDAAMQYGRTRGDQVCVYKDVNYIGTEQCYNAGDEIPNLGAQSKSISSLRIFGRATVTVYENRSFEGRSAEFNSDVPDLGRRTMQGNTTWSDHIESLRVGGVSRNGNVGSGNGNINDQRNPGDYRRNQPQQPRNGICVYERANYEGRSECWDEGERIPDLASQGRNWNGQISSIRLFGRSVAVVYQDSRYRGESLTVDRDIPDLGAIRGRRGNGNGRGRGNGRNLESWNDQISSIQVQAQRRY